MAKLHRSNGNRILAVLVLTLSGCASIKAIFSDRPAPDKTGKPLTFDEAKARVRVISKIDYALDFKLDATREFFQARAEIHFDLKAEALKDDAGAVFLDFYHAKILSLVVNDRSVSASDISNLYDGARLRFSKRLLRVSANSVVIQYERAYATDGRGLHRFKDPADQKVYLYSNFEPYDANRMFPCFDQPDLKAHFDLIVRAPKDWLVIANTREREVSVEGEAIHWKFPRTPVFSTYLFALHAGPYASWEYRNTKIPLRLFARQSLAQYVDSGNWFSMTEKGLKFYESLFDFPYPFKKYDQLLVPDFNAGAMENIAAVTFSERYVYRSKMTLEQIRGRANTVLHEMAHMWFGDLVTMDWWSGLWLNESFATFMASLSVDRALKIPGIQEAFHMRSKRSAFREDGYPSNHPIQQPVANTDESYASFDDITYGKGASVLKQLQFRLGERAFFSGVRSYFQKHRFQNTTLDDFLDALSAASGQKLTQFKKEWLESKGFERLVPQWSCQAGTIQTFTISQMADPQSEVKSRTHSFEVALYDANDKARIFPVLMSSLNESITGLIGTPCPQWVQLNYGDYGHFQPVLDPVSLRAIQARISDLPDSLVRLNLWTSIWDSVITGQGLASDYLSFAQNAFTKEQSDVILSFLSATTFRAPLQSLSAVKIQTRELREKAIRNLETLYWDLLHSSDAGSDLQRFWFLQYLEVAQTSNAIANLNQIFTGAIQIDGMDITQDRRWDLLKALARNQSEGIEKLLKNEVVRDPSDEGFKENSMATALIPSREGKDRLWKIFVDPLPSKDPAYRFSAMRKLMGGFFSLSQEHFANEFRRDFFSALPGLVTARGDDYGEIFVKNVFPSLCEAENVSRADGLIKDSSALLPQTRKALIEAREIEDHCVKARGREVAR